jgi:general secretion pathway protein L
MTRRKIAEAFWSWMNSVAGSLVALIGGIRSPRRLRLVEEGRDTFRVEISQGRRASVSLGHEVRIVNGRVGGTLPASLATALRRSRIELVLQPDRFLFRPLELPKRATEFLEGVVRAQIDRLTPWSANDAVFGWTPPNPQEKERILLTVVATARALITPYLQALAGLGAGSIVVSTIPQGLGVQGLGIQDLGATAAPVQVLEHSAHSALDIRRVRGALAAVLVVMGLAALIAVVADQFAADALEAQRQDLSQRISERHSSMRRDGLSGTAPAQTVLERRKRETPSSVMVIEALSQILPDHTYVTELRVEGDKLQVIGVTRDAPSLIRLIEQSPHFTRATFFAPTTRSSGDPGERFHIEARIKPVFSSRT